MAKIRNTKNIQVNKKFDEAIKKAIANAEFKRGRKLSYNEITLELSRLNLDKVFNKMLFG